MFPMLVTACNNYWAALFFVSCRSYICTQTTYFQKGNLKEILLSKTKKISTCRSSQMPKFKHRHRPVSNEEQQAKR